MWIALFKLNQWLWENLTKISNYRPFFQNPKSTKIILITAFVHEKNAKYLTKHESLYILMLHFLIWNGLEAS
jgi:hypothetical protein